MFSIFGYEEWIPKFSPPLFFYSSLLCIALSALLLFLSFLLLFSYTPPFPKRFSCVTGVLWLILGLRYWSQLLHSIHIVDNPISEVFCTLSFQVCLVLAILPPRRSIVPMLVSSFYSLLLNLSF